jgi:hypothetical protein
MRDVVCWIWSDDGEHAVNPVGAQQGEDLAFTLDVVVSIEDGKHVAVLDDSAFDTAQHKRKEGVCDIRDDDTDDAGATGFQTSGMIVWVIVEVAHRLPDAPLQQQTDCVAVVENVGDSANRDLGSAGNFLNSGVALMNISLLPLTIKIGVSA